MSVLNENTIIGASAAGGDYEIEQSLRFDDGRGTYLSRTTGTWTDGKKYTLSMWVKRATLSTDQQLLTNDKTSSGNTGFTFLKFDTNNKLYMYFHSSAGSSDWYSDAVFRDTSAWYHIVHIFDSANSTAADRGQVYVNGTRLTSAAGFDTAIPVNFVPEFTESPSMFLGINGAEGSYNQVFDGYMAEVNFIDGQALTPDNFGETGDYGEWKPTKYNGAYGTNGFYLTFGNTTVIAATGGTITTDGDYKVHTFNSTGTFAVTSVSGMGVVEYLVIAGGGGSASIGGGGGGAGGYRTGIGFAVSEQNYTVTVGAGGAQNTSGSNSVFSTITSIGGGRGASSSASAAAVGGSGGGGGRDSVASAAGTAGQGNAGGVGIFAASAYGGGGGGGAGAVGAAGTSSAGGAGGAGLASSITGSSVYRAGGGGGGTYNGASVGAGGNGGGGSAGVGTANTGGGGGAANNNGAGSAGGSGVVIIRYRFQG